MYVVFELTVWFHMKGVNYIMPAYPLGYCDQMESTSSERNVRESICPIKTNTAISWDFIYKEINEWLMWRIMITRNSDDRYVSFTIVLSATR